MSLHVKPPPHNRPRPAPAPTPEQRGRLLELYRSFDAAAELDKRTDAEVAEMLKELHAELEIASPFACLVETAISRLARSGLGSIESFP